MQGKNVLVRQGHHRPVTRSDHDTSWLGLVHDAAVTSTTSSRQVPCAFSSRKALVNMRSDPKPAVVDPVSGRMPLNGQTRMLRVPLGEINATRRFAGRRCVVLNATCTLSTVRLAPTEIGKLPAVPAPSR